MNVMEGKISVGLGLNGPNDGMLDFQESNPISEINCAGAPALTATQTCSWRQRLECSSNHEREASSRWSRIPNIYLLRC